MEAKFESSQWNQVEEVELIFKSKVKASQRPKVTSSDAAYKIFLQTWDINKIELVEEFKVMLLNRANKVMSVFCVSSGGVTGTVADPKIIFAAALKRAACNIILCHNHPSGELSPSKADEELTNKMVGGGKFLDIKVLDHLIVSSEGYFSFADQGLL
ncbi:MAG TPA: JAB domain-containing protein [Puia sp.]|nr:JAB domain-containing protein [Puia sp.]